MKKSLLCCCELLKAVLYRSPGHPGRQSCCAFPCVKVQGRFGTWLMPAGEGAGRAGRKKTAENNIAKLFTPHAVKG